MPFWRRPWSLPFSERARLRRRSRTGGPPWRIAMTAALVFAVHPVQTQAVTYIVQRFASLATLFYLLSVVSYLKARLEAGEQGMRAKGAALYAIALFSAVLAMMTKETAFTLPFAIALCEVMFFTGAFRRFYYVLPFLLTLPLIPLNLMATSAYSEDFSARSPRRARRLTLYPGGHTS